MKMRERAKLSKGFQSQRSASAFVNRGAVFDFRFPFKVKIRHNRPLKLPLASISLFSLSLRRRFDRIFFFFFVSNEPTFLSDCPLLDLIEFVYRYCVTCIAIHEVREKGRNTRKLFSTKLRSLVAKSLKLLVLRSLAMQKRSGPDAVLGKRQYSRGRTQSGIPPFH